MQQKPKIENISQINSMLTVYTYIWYYIKMVKPIVFDDYDYDDDDGYVLLLIQINAATPN